MGRSDTDQTTPVTADIPDLTTGRPDQAGPDPAPYDAYDLELISTWIWEGNPNTEE
jgi:hypothetical protein